MKFKEKKKRKRTDIFEKHIIIIRCYNFTTEQTL